MRMNEDKNKNGQDTPENMPAPIDGNEMMVVGSSERLSSAHGDFEVERSSGGDLIEEPRIHVYASEGQEESMHGGYASVNGKRKSDNKLIWIIVALMTVLCVVVGVCSSVLTGIFMRKGEQPPVIGTDGKVQQNIAAVVSARKSNIAEISCSGLKGSGIVMKREGNTVYVLTNAHVIAGYVEMNKAPAVKFYGEDGFYSADVVGYDSFYDVAVIKLNHNTVYTIYDLDGSDYFSPDVKYNEGDHVVSIGNAMGMGIASYAGIISRSSELLECDKLFNEGGKKTVPVFRTTAVINAGMSGCGVFDMNGNLIGLGTYRMSNSVGVDQEGGANTDVEDTGFATPISVFYPIYKRILANGDGGEVGLATVRPSITPSSVGDLTSDIYKLSLPFGFACEYRNGLLTVSAIDQNVTLSQVAVGDVVTSIGSLQLITVTEDGETVLNTDVCAAIGTVLCYNRQGSGAVFRMTFESGNAIVVGEYRYAV